MLREEFAALQCWDVRALGALTRREGAAFVDGFFELQVKPQVLLIRPVDSLFVSERRVKFFEGEGFRVVSVIGVTHGLHLDDPAIFERLLVEFASH